MLLRVEPLFNKLPATVRSSPSGKAFGKLIDIAKKTAVGAAAMNFTHNDTSGVAGVPFFIQGKVCNDRFLGELVWPLPC